MKIWLPHLQGGCEKEEKLNTNKESKKAGASVVVRLRRATLRFRSQKRGNATVAKTLLQGTLVRGRDRYSTSAKSTVKNDLVPVTEPAGGDKNEGA